jgi:hypothetical protein
MEAMDTPAVVAWLRGLQLQAAAQAAEQHGVDGPTLVALMADGGLSELGVTTKLAAAKITGGARILEREAPEPTNERPAKRARRSAPTSPPPEPTSTSSAVAADQHDDTAAAAAPPPPPKSFDTAPDGEVTVYVSPPPEALECAICLDAKVMRDPHIIRGAGCSHSFCRQCLVSCLERERQCPKCRSPAADQGAVADLIVRNTDMCGIAAAQRVHCRAGVMQMDGEWYVDPGGCPEQMAKDELEPHMTTCAHVRVACRMAEHGCGWRGKRGEQPAHEALCVYVQLEPFVLATKAEQDVTKAELAATKTELAAVKGACAAGGSIIALIWDVRDARKTELALDKLAELACDNCTATQALGAAGACEAVLMAMQGHTAVVAVQRAGCWALANLAHANPANKQAVAAAGGVEVVLTAMRTHAADSDVQEYGCASLASLAMNSANQQAIAAAGGVEVVLTAMRTHAAESEVQNDGCRLLANLALNSANEQAIAAAGGVEVVLTAMRTHAADSEVQDNGCRLLANLAENSANEQAIAAAGGVEVVLTAMRTHAAESDVQDSGCRLLVNLALDSAVRATAVTGGAAAVVEAARARFPLHAEVQRLTQRLLSIF